MFSKKVRKKSVLVFVASLVALEGFVLATTVLGQSGSNFIAAAGTLLGR